MGLEKSSFLSIPHLVIVGFILSGCRGEVTVWGVYPVHDNQSIPKAVSCQSPNCLSQIVFPKAAGRQVACCCCRHSWPRGPCSPQVAPHPGVPGSAQAAGREERAFHLHRPNAGSRKGGPEEKQSRIVCLFLERIQGTCTCLLRIMTRNSSYTI